MTNNELVYLLLISLKYGTLPKKLNGLSYPYQVEEPTFIYRGIGRNFSFSLQFSMKIKLANRIAPDGTPQNAASHLGLFCLPMSHKKDAWLIWHLKMKQNEPYCEKTSFWVFRPATIQTNLRS